MHCSILPLRAAGSPDGRWRLSGCARLCRYERQMRDMAVQQAMLLGSLGGEADEESKEPDDEDGGAQEGQMMSALARAPDGGAGALAERGRTGAGGDNAADHFSDESSDRFSDEVSEDGDDERGEAKGQLVAIERGDKRGPVQHYVVASSGARVTPGNAMELLHHYCQLLPHDK
jgi:hypothetical protein